MLNCELEDKVSELSFVELTISIDITLLKNRLQLFLPFFIIKWSHLWNLDVFERQLWLKSVCFTTFPVSIELFVHLNKTIRLIKFEVCFKHVFPSNFSISVEIKNLKFFTVIRVGRLPKVMYSEGILLSLLRSNYSKHESTFEHKVLNKSSSNSFLWAALRKEIKSMFKYIYLHFQKCL